MSEIKKITARTMKWKWEEQEKMEVEIPIDKRLNIN